MYLILFLNISHVSHISHVYQMFHILHLFLNIYHVSRCFSKYSQKMFCKILHTDFTKIPVCCSYAPWVYSYCYNAHCRQSKSIQTDSLLIGSKFMSIYSNSNAAIAKLSFNIRLLWFSIIIIIINPECWLMLSIGTSNVFAIGSW